MLHILFFLIKAMGTESVRISYRSPWQNGTAERWIEAKRVKTHQLTV
jgi:hypothetical protein